MKTGEKISLILGVSIPVLMILFVAGSIYLPGLFVQPRFNFLYATGDIYYTHQQYSVENGRLIKHEVEPRKFEVTPPPAPKLFLHNATENKNREISFEEASSLKLRDSIESPDGFKIVYGNDADGGILFLFGPSTDYSTNYLVGHGTSKKLNIEKGAGSYFRFLGWIE